ncbi:glycosyltransferase family 2 protein [Candidatus Chloroploca sp. M-50]|uniref:Glycosyltransferase family 2 protein n=1 Tax=Candidatus Chloroploca mongolica TaxID=2528176 RepID=A0ABS4D463_9CHLR|nr:glycosyltransferase family A protein [Candidatus Chloroploca mongolica]MBP1464212.1 glycosyltransferase family 2 protein [Candidatus Chloroploca mongolica]
MHERLSVIIPVYNGERFLAEAIQSVLDQTLPPDEIIVVDDGSTDGSAALVAARFAEVRLLRQTNRGVGAALNLGLSHAHGDLFAFLDADDRWLPDKLERQVAALSADPALDMVFGHVRQFQDNQNCTEAPRPAIHRGALLIRRHACERVGTFTEDPGVNEIVAWYAKSQTVGLRSFILPHVVFERRIHAHNSGGGRSPEALRQSYLRALRQVVRQRPSEEENA